MCNALKVRVIPPPLTGISVIMPAFNVEKYLGRAVESIIKQTYREWELIIIDDKSSDRTKDLIQDFVKIDKRIIGVFLDNNTGSPLIPREMGLKNAKYEWITFIDADDCVEANYLEIISKRQRQTKADIVMSRQYLENHNPLPSDDFDFSQIKKGKDCVLHTLHGWQIPGNANCLFGRNLYYEAKKCAIDYSLHFADEFLFRVMLFNSNTVAFTKAKYYYTENPVSITRKSGNIKRFDSVILWQKYSEIFEKEFPRDSKEYSLIELSRFSDALACLLYLANYEFEKEQVKEAKSRIKKSLKKIDWSVVRPCARSRQYYPLRCLGVDLSYFLFRMINAIRK